ncbi:hypothetical protein CO660_28060 [Rhizobium sp. L9]|nr:hypothetical protein CO660_28060 [Rhizobium sp. L9]
MFEGMREEVHRFDGIIILISCSDDRHFFAGQLCVMRKAGISPSDGQTPKAKRPLGRKQALGKSRKWWSVWR